LADPDETEAAFVARDETAFNHLVVTYERRVFALAFRMLGRRDEAEDLSQEVFVQVFKAIDQFRSESKLSTWIYRCMPAGAVVDVAIRSASTRDDSHPMTHRLRQWLVLALPARRRRRRLAHVRYALGDQRQLGVHP